MSVRSFKKGNTMLHPIAYFAPSTILLMVGTISDRMPRVRYTRNGGMRFLRVGRVQLSFCICRKPL